MALTVVVGGQYGSEGKGKVTAYLAVRDDADIVVRCGGPNSGHTVDLGGRRYELRCLPAGFVNSRARLLLAAGSLINPEILLSEIKATWIDPGMVGVDRNAGIISHSDAEEETRLHLRDRLGSTLSGAGVAVANRALRTSSFMLAKDVPELQRFLTDVSAEVNLALDKSKRVIIEGTQGFGLSVYHSPCYPFATSRDTTASGFLSEVGVSPRLVTDIVMCVRTYPIRVGGNSGPLMNEITWEEVRARSGYPFDIREYATTTKRLRRVGLFDVNIVRQASRANRPTHVALHGVDYLSYVNKGASRYDQLDTTASTFITDLNESLQVSVSLVGTGPTNEDLIDLTRRGA